MLNNKAIILLNVADLGWAFSGQFIAQSADLLALKEMSDLKWIELHLHVKCDCLTFWMFYIDFSFLLRPSPWNVSFPVIIIIIIIVIIIIIFNLQKSQRIF